LEACLEGVAALCDALRGDIYAVLGNHDSIAMVPDLEALGIRMLLNECIAIDRGGALIYLAALAQAELGGRRLVPSPPRGGRSRHRCDFAEEKMDGQPEPFAARTHLG
jgi:hypothetical protein